MCKFKSAIVLKSKIVCPLDKDSHSEILNDLGIKDDNSFPNFVRIEMIPIDGDVFNHDLSNWKLNVDQDFRPEWFDHETTERQFKEFNLPEIFEKCFTINDQSWREYKNTKIYVKNSKVRIFHCSVVAWENSSVEAWGNSSVVAKGNSSVVIPYSASVKIKDVSGNATVKDLSGIKPKIIIANDFEIVKFGSGKS